LEASECRAVKMRVGAPKTESSKLPAPLESLDLCDLAKRNRDGQIWADEALERPTGGELDALPVEKETSERPREARPRKKAMPRVGRTPATDK
jgi:hypothetical protein